MVGRIDIQNVDKDKQRQNEKKKPKSNRAKANALYSVYKLYGVANIPVYLTRRIYKTARLMDDIVIIYYDYYNFRHCNSPYAFHLIIHAVGPLSFCTQQTKSACFCYSVMIYIQKRHLQL